MLNLNGIWTNSNGEDRDIVEICRCGNGFFIHGTYVTEDGRMFENIGYAKSRREYIDVGDRLKVTWTDTCDSKGSQRGTVHRTIIEIVSPTQLKQISDRVITGNRNFGNRTSYGNWDRTLTGIIPRKVTI